VQGQPGSECNHREKYNAFHEEVWSHDAFKKFYGFQWQFLVQKFNAKEFDYTLDDNRIVPIKINKSRKVNNQSAKRGAFGIVSWVEILQDYQDALEKVN